MGTLEDVTMSVWMLAYGVQPVHLPMFVDVHTTDECDDTMADPISIAGLQVTNIIVVS